MNYQREIRIAASPERVFAFHESPGALERLTPPWERVVVESGGDSLRVGSRVVIKMRLGPFVRRWVAEHTAYDPPRLFADRQVSGPFARWEHRHEFVDDGAGGTILRDSVEFEPPCGMLGRIFLRGFVLYKLDRMFAYRHELTKRLVETNEF